MSEEKTEIVNVQMVMSRYFFSYIYLNMLEHYFYNLILNDHFYFDKLLLWMVFLSAINFDLQSKKKGVNLLQSFL